MSAEGCFEIVIQDYKTLTGYTVNLVFKLAQHSRDEQLLKSFIKYLECGRLNKQAGQDAVYFIVQKHHDILEKIIPFFFKYPIIGVKALNFLD